MDDKLKKTLTCMMIGTSLYNLVLLILSTIFFIIYYKNTNNSFILILKNELCLILGYILSMIAIYSMALSITKVVNANDESFAIRHMTIMSSIVLSVQMMLNFNYEFGDLFSNFLILVSTNYCHNVSESSRLDPPVFPSNALHLN